MASSLYQKLRNSITHWLIDEPPTNEVMPYDFNRLKHEIRPGDVLLIEGRSRISTIIRSITQSSWTHAAIYIGRMIDFEDETVIANLKKQTNASSTTHLLIEDLMDKGTTITPLSEYHNHHIRICRPIGITPSDLKLVIEYAINALGHPYNVRHIFDLARFVLPWRFLPRRWGSSLFRTRNGQPESSICSALIAEAYTSVHFPILPFVRIDEADGLEVIHRNPHLFTPKDFDTSPYFEIIKYPLFNPDEPLPYYRRMPWAQKGTLHHDEGIISTPMTEAAPKRKLNLFKRRKQKSTSKDK